MRIKSKEDFESLELGKKLYDVSGSNISSCYYAGFSPKSNHVMLINGGDLSKVNTYHVKKSNENRFTIVDDYNEAKIIMWKYVNDRVKSIKDIYFKDWTEQQWRDYNISEIIKKDE